MSLPAPTLDTESRASIKHENLGEPKNVARGNLVISDLTFYPTWPYIIVG